MKVEKKDVDELLLITIDDLKKFCEEGMQNGKSTGKITKKTSKSQLDLLDDLAIELKTFRDSLPAGWQREELTTKIIDQIIHINKQLYLIRQNKVNGDNYIWDTKLDAKLVEREMPLLLKEILLLETRVKSYLNEYSSKKVLETTAA